MLRKNGSKLFGLEKGSKIFGLEKGTNLKWIIGHNEALSFWQWSKAECLMCPK
jgi:hypothetical protein